MSVLKFPVACIFYALPMGTDRFSGCVTGGQSEAEGAGLEGSGRWLKVAAVSGLLTAHVVSSLKLRGRGGTLHI